MSDPIKESVKEEIRILFGKGLSLRGITKELGISRNSVRKLVRNEHLSLPLLPPTKPPVTSYEVSTVAPALEALDFLMLEKMFAQIGEPASGRDYEKHIKALAIGVGKELGVSGRIDVLRLEVAVANYISWRRFYFRSLEAGEKTYCGPFAKRHDKVAKAADSWVAASNKAFDQMNRLLRELEVKYGKRGPDLGRNNTFVQNQQINLPQKDSLATSQPSGALTSVFNPEIRAREING